jgi:hypothetical protein
MTRSERLTAQAQIRELSRQVRALKLKIKIPSPAKPWKGRTRAEDQKAKRETHRQQTARIREERIRIAGGKCEAYLFPEGPWEMSSLGVPFGQPPVQCAGSAEHMHHLLGGSGRRRQKQSVENVRMLCAFHHREAHRAQHKEATP